MTLQHRQVLRHRNKGIKHRKRRQADSTHVVQRGQMAIGRDEEVLIDSGMIQVMSDGCEDGTHLLHRRQVG